MSMPSTTLPLPQPPPLQQQQPVVVYPSTATTHPSSKSHSNGSFGTVFIVLAAIVVVSAVACFLGRFCNRRVSNTKLKQNSSSVKPCRDDAKHGKRGANGGDLEFGFDPRGNSKDIEFGFGSEKKEKLSFPKAFNREPGLYKPHGSGRGNLKGGYGVPTFDDHIEFRSGS